MISIPVRHKWLSLLLLLTFLFAVPAGRAEWMTYGSPYGRSFPTYMGGAAQFYPPSPNYRHRIPRFASPRYPSFASPQYRSPQPSFAPRHQLPQNRYSQPSLGSGTGSDYLQDIAEDGLYVWPAEKLPVKVFIASGNGVPGYRPSFRQHLINAFDEWAKVSQGKLGWQLVSNPEYADIVCQWANRLPVGDAGPEAGRTVTTTHLNRLTGVGTIASAKMYILTRMGNRQFSDAEIKRTTLHEVGHAYGLQGHSPHYDDVMYFSTSAQQPPYLSRRDTATINRLYSSYPPIGTASARDRYPWAGRS